MLKNNINRRKKIPGKDIDESHGGSLRSSLATIARAVPPIIPGRKNTRQAVEICRVSLNGQGKPTELSMHFSHRSVKEMLTKKDPAIVRQSGPVEKLW